MGDKQNKNRRLSFKQFKENCRFYKKLGSDPKYKEAIELINALGGEDILGEDGGTFGPQIKAHENRLKKIEDAIDVIDDELIFGLHGISKYEERAFDKTQEELDSTADFYRKELAALKEINELLPFH